MYCMRADPTRADFAAIVRCARSRFHPIWRFDLRAHVERAAAELARELGVLGTGDKGEQDMGEGEGSVAS
jgi:hypothetical protein